jgi:hypothetical protein
MRYVEFKTGLQTFISGEEQELIEAIDEKGLVNKKDLNEREQEVAKRLAEKSILIRQNTDDKIYFKISRQADHHTSY